MNYAARMCVISEDRGGTTGSARHHGMANRNCRQSRRHGALSPAPRSARHRAAGRSRSRGAHRARPAATCLIAKALTRVDEFQRAAPVASGPRAAIAGLEDALAVVDAGAREDWLETARLQAILQPCSRSLPGLRSGLRCWQAFCTRVLHHSHIALPPAATELAAWSTVFRCKGTFDNYVSYVRVGCLLAGADVRVFDDPVVRRARPPPIPIPRGLVVTDAAVQWLGLISI